MISVQTAKPIALDSPDHLVPRGTAQDNSVHLPFNRLLYELIPAKQVRLLDLGCAGGGFVKSILDDGGFAVGIEGSDYSKQLRRAEWATIPGNLFTADVTEPFRIVSGNMKRQYVEPKIPPWDYREETFNIITAWEFFEHIATNRLPDVMANIKRHLDPDGYVIGSICSAYDINYGIHLHQTVQFREWWVQFFSYFGFKTKPYIESHFGGDWLRGPKSAQSVAGSFLVVLQLAREEP